jgi:hypothetical protein
MQGDAASVARRCEGGFRPKSERIRGEDIECAFPHACCVQVANPIEENRTVQKSNLQELGKGCRVGWKVSIASACVAHSSYLTICCFRLLEDSNFEDALRYVLGKGDIDLLISTCRVISIHDVFYGARSPPATDVLLSLIHQLSSEMAADVVLKARWVREAAQSLDRTQDVFEKHAQSVLADALIAIEVAYGRCSDQAAASELRSCLYVVRTQLS